MVGSARLAELAGAGRTGWAGLAGLAAPSGAHAVPELIGPPYDLL